MSPVMLSFWSMPIAHCSANNKAKRNERMSPAFVVAQSQITTVCECKTNDKKNSLRLLRTKIIRAITQCLAITFCFSICERSESTTGCHAIQSYSSVPVYVWQCDTVCCVCDFIQMNKKTKRKRMNLRESRTMDKLVCAYRILSHGEQPMYARAKTCVYARQGTNCTYTQHT